MRFTYIKHCLNGILTAKGTVHNITSEHDF